MRRSSLLTIFAAGGVVVLAVLLAQGGAPPVTVDGLRVMTVGEVLDARTAGGLHDQPVAVEGYWSNGAVGHSCPLPLDLQQPGALEMHCVDGEWGITEENEPMMLMGRFGLVHLARGPHLTPYFEHDGPTTRSYWHEDGSGWGSPPVPIIVIGHFDDPRADQCRASQRQKCEDRLVVDRIAYFNASLARWSPDIPTPEPTDPPAPSHY